jgi:large subunit ribosomal protein L10
VLSRTQKESQIEELRGKLQRAKSVFLVDFRGLPVGAQNQLRGRMRSEGEGDFEYQVAKNTLLRRAVDGSEAAPLADQFVGPTAIAISYGDPVGLAKILVDYEKQYEIFSVKGGLVEGATVAREEIATLATLPTLDALRGKIVGLSPGWSRRARSSSRSRATPLDGIFESSRGATRRARHCQREGCDTWLISTQSWIRCRASP